MKKMMITGGLEGFLIGLIVGLATPDSTWPGITFRASAAALAGGWLFRWWCGVLIHNLNAAQQEPVFSPAKNGESKAKAPREN